MPISLTLPKKYADYLGAEIIELHLPSGTVNVAEKEMEEIEGDGEDLYVWLYYKQVGALLHILVVYQEKEAPHDITWCLTIYNGVYSITPEEEDE